MKLQRGFYNFDLMPFFIVAGIVCAVIGAFLLGVSVWAWPYIKAFIHGATA